MKVTIYHMEERSQSDGQHLRYDLTVCTKPQIHDLLQVNLGYVTCMDVYF